MCGGAAVKGDMRQLRAGIGHTCKLGKREGQVAPRPLLLLGCNRRSHCTSLRARRAWSLAVCAAALSLGLMFKVVTEPDPRIDVRALLAGEKTMEGGIVLPQNGRLGAGPFQGGPKMPKAVNARY